MSYPTYDPIVIWNFLEHWSQKTFGTDAERGPVGPLKHLKKEADEAISKPNDIFEYADCLFLLFDATRRAGFNLQQLWDAAIEKSKELETRTYPKPTTDEPSEHIRPSIRGEDVLLEPDKRAGTRLTHPVTAQPGYCPSHGVKLERMPDGVMGCRVCPKDADEFKKLDGEQHEHVIVDGAGDKNAPKCDCSAGANARLYEHHRDCHWLQYVTKCEPGSVSGERNAPEIADICKVCNQLESGLFHSPYSGRNHHAFQSAAKAEPVVSGEGQAEVPPVMVGSGDREDVHPAWAAWREGLPKSVLLRPGEKENDLTRAYDAIVRSKAVSGEGGERPPAETFADNFLNGNLWLSAATRNEQKEALAVLLKNYDSHRPSQSAQGPVSRIIKPGDPMPSLDREYYSDADPSAKGPVKVIFRGNRIESIEAAQGPESNMEARLEREKNNPQSVYAGRWPNAAHGPCWISVEESGLPKVGQWCWVVCNGIVQRMAANLQGKGFACIDGYEWAWALDEADPAPVEAVSHWQPFPEPPGKDPARTETPQPISRFYPPPRFCSYCGACYVNGERHEESCDRQGQTPDAAQLLMVMRLIAETPIIERGMDIPNAAAVLQQMAKNVLAERGGSPARSHDYHPEYVEAVEKIGRLEAQLAAQSGEARLREALQRLYDETVNYIRINNLGDVHHNQAMQMARDALALGGV